MNATNETFIIQEAVAVGLKSKSYLSPTLRANQFRNDQPGSMVYVINKMLVRRLTPLECERLQGFPDGWTANIKSDLVRYRMLGNAVCRNVAEWIGKQIVEVVNGGS